MQINLNCSVPNPNHCKFRD